MKCDICTTEVKGGWKATVQVEGIGSKSMSFTTPVKSSEKAAFTAALHRLKHIYL